MLFAAPETAEPAELVTRERPCCALPTVSWVASLALVAPEDAAFAASEVVEAARRWTAHRDWRRANLGAIRADIVFVERCEATTRVNGGSEVVSLPVKEVRGRT